MGLLGWALGREKGKKWGGGSIVPTITVTDADHALPKNGIGPAMKGRGECAVGSVARGTEGHREEEETTTVNVEDEPSGSVRIIPSPTPATLMMMDDQPQPPPTTTNHHHHNQPAAASVVYDLEAQCVIANTAPSPAVVTMVENGRGVGGGGQQTQQSQQQFRTLQKRFPVTEVVANFACILIAGVLVEGVSRLIGPYRRGFFCDDDTIRLPYKTSTVPVWLLFSYCLLVTGLAFILGEYLRLTGPKTAHERITYYEEGEPLRVRLLIRWVFFHGYFFIALIATLIFTAVAKYPVGRLRPHFIDICRPHIGNQSEADYCLLPANHHQYMQQYECTSGVRPSLIAEARLSFFSGHSSLAMCAAIFTAIYLQARLAPLFRHAFIVPLLQMGTLSSAMFIAYSRIQDHMHHWSDVLIGMSTGSSVAAFVALNIVGLRLNNSRQRLGQFIPVPDKNGANSPSSTTTVPEGM